jgi:micrococcal nuclease
MSISRYFRGQRTPHIRWRPYWQRHPIASAVIVVLLILAYVDHRGYLGWQGDDRMRFHDRTFNCVAVMDGDTFEIDISDGRYTRTRVRLWGVDTPEIPESGREPGYYGREASAFSKNALLSKQIRLELAPGRTRDKYGRVLAYGYLHETGELFNATLIETGHGYADPRFEHPHMASFVELEKRARTARLGLWKEITKESMPPWRRKLEE